MGGNLVGIARRIDYLKKLGVNAVYLTPIFKGKYYHGYHVIDYFEIDPHFGNKKKFKKLVGILHKNNIKLIFDFVPNHCSNEHPFFKEATSNKNSKYKDWFVFKKWPKDYLSFLDVKELPKFNFENPEVQEYLIEVANYWVKNFEIDALRIDHAVGPTIEFWKKFRKEIEVPLIAEAGYARGLTCGRPLWKESNLETIWLTKSFTKKEMNLLKELIKTHELKTLIEVNELWMKKLEKYFDGFMDFAFRDIVWGVANHSLEVEEAFGLLEKHYKKFKKKTSLIALLSNHDFNRFSYIFGKEAAVAFSSLQFLVNQPLLIYYGEESGLSQKSRVDNSTPYSDIEARRFMNWYSIDKKLFDHYRTLIKFKLSSV